MSADKRIVEALAGHRLEAFACSRFGKPGIWTCDDCGAIGEHSAGHRRHDLHRQHLAAVLEPIVREREAAAWREGDKYGYAGAMGHAVPHLGNPYRIEAANE